MYEQGEGDAVGGEEGAEEGQRRHRGGRGEVGGVALFVSVNFSAAVIGIFQGLSVYFNYEML